MGDVLLVAFHGIAPTLMCAFLLGHLMLAREVSALRSSPRGRLYLGLVFGLMSVVGAVFGLRRADVYVDTALFVVVAGGLSGGMTCGLASGVIGGLVRLVGPASLRPFAIVTILGGVAGGALHRALSGRRLRPWEGFLLGAAVGVGQAVITVCLVRKWPGPEVLVQAMVPLGGLTGFGLLSFLLILQMLEARIEQGRLREELAETRVRFLQAQIRPHFLFNALNTLGSLVRTDPTRAREVVQSLAEFLRATFKTTAPIVPFAEELALVRAYLDVERARFGARLGYAQVVEPECLAQPVPSLLLQPIVENSVRHGFREDGRPLEIGLTARRDGDALVIAVQDDGVGFAAEALAPPSGAPPAAGALPAAAGGGIGLGNCRERLAHLYPGGRASLAVVSTPGQGTRVEVRVPWPEASTGRPA